MTGALLLRTLNWQILIKLYSHNLRSLENRINWRILRTLN